jgi:hypothetical protein
MVFNGVHAVTLLNDDLTFIDQYFDKYGLLPKVLIFREAIYILASSIKKAKEIEEVLRFQLQVYEHSGEKVQALQNEELLYLANWEAEKYRQNI